MSTGPDSLGAMFRAAASTDFDAIMMLYRQLHPRDPIVADGSDRTAFDTILSQEWLQIYVLERDTKIIATTYLNIVPNLTRSASPYAVIENVVVEETLRGRGHGREIMDRTLERAWAAGCYKVMLMTGSRRESTHAFYRACGFSPDAKTAYLVRPS